MPRLRTFIAVDVNKAVRNRLVKLQQTLARSGVEVKWVEPENLHVTLLFLGEVEDRQVPTVCTLMAQETARHSAFLMAVEKVGCFPNPRQPRILWAGVGHGTQELCAVHDAVEVPLQDLGFRREERRYTPHITLGRVKSDRSTVSLVESLARQAEWSGGEAQVTELLVMSSELRPKGPVYTVLSRPKLGGREG